MKECSGSEEGAGAGARSLVGVLDSTRGGGFEGVSEEDGLGGAGARAPMLSLSSPYSFHSSISSRS